MHRRDIAEKPDILRDACIYAVPPVADRSFYSFPVRSPAAARRYAMLAIAAMVSVSCATESPSTSRPEPTDQVAADTVRGSKDSVAFDPAQTTSDLQRFWRANATAVGADRYEPVAADRLLLLGSEPIACNGDDLEDRDIEGNALALECEEGYTIAWDPGLFDEMTGKYGPAAPAMILAHEWGHIVGFQAGSNLDGVLAEQYADCMAGVWVAHAIEKGLPPFDVLGALDATVAAAADFSDEPGDDPTNPDAHGSAFDRIRAFQEGFEAWPSFCGSYETTPPSLTETPFDRGADRNADGNLAFGEILPLATKLLEQFEADRPDAVSVAGMRPIGPQRKDLASLHRRVGDAAPLVVLALDASAAAQERQGRDPEDDGELLQQACVVGGFLRWLADGGSEDISLSAGDVDEAVATFVDLTDPAASGFLFEQVAQLRTGFTQGAQACELPTR